MAGGTTTTGRGIWSGTTALGTVDLTVHGLRRPPQTSSVGAGRPSERARKQSVRNSRTFRPCWRQVAVTLRTLSTKRLPHSLAVPPLDLRHKTAWRNARSAALFVGSTPCTLRKVHRCSSPSSNLRHVAAVFPPPRDAPRPSTCRTPHRIG